MFIRRRRLLWLVVVIGSSWVVISTYFVRSNVDNDARQQDSHYNDRFSRSSSKVSARINAARSTGFVASKDFYYDDDNGEAVIDIVQDKSTPRPTPRLHSYFREFKTGTHVAYVARENEIDHKESNAEDRFEHKAEMSHLETATRSSVLRWRKAATPKVKEFPSLDFPEQTSKRLISSSDNAKRPPGK